MTDNVRLSSEPDAPPAQVARVIDAIDACNTDVTGARDYRPVAVFLRVDDPPGERQLILHKELE
ncbi:MAG TPA: hypothetical protein VGK16_13775 [Candidatus Limnocylindrales bacterium]|jgi:hypothetical protein